MVALAGMRAALTPAWVRDPLWRRARAVPSLDLPFARDKSLRDAITGQQLITFTRASNATVVGSNGVISTVADNIPRFGHNPLTGECLGLLVEEQRTNLLLRSEEFDNASWTRTGLLAFGSGSTANATTAPDGQVTADLLTENASTSEHRIETPPVSWIASTAYTFTIFARASGRSRIDFFGVGGGNFTGGREADFNLATGTVVSTDGATASIEPLPGGWYRLRMSFTTSASPSASSLFIRLNDNSGNFSYAGDGASGIFLWGAQLEVGAFATSYIPTTGTAATRAADVATIVSGVEVSALRALYAQFSSPANGIRGIASLNNNTANQRIELSTSGADPLAVVVDGGVTQASIDAGTVTANQRAQLAASFGANAFAASLNGGAEVLDASGTLPAVDRIFIGRTQAGEYLNGPIARLAGWTQAPPTLPVVRA